MSIGLSWNLALLLFGFGLSLQAAAALLVLALGTTRPLRAHRIGQAAALFVFLGIALEVIALFVPSETTVEGYWFVLGAVPLLLPGILVRLAASPSSEPAGTAGTAPKGAVSSPSPPGPAGTAAPTPTESPEREDRPPREFQRFLEEIPAVLARHPEGLTLVEIGREMNVEWRKLTGAARELLDRGLVRKVEKRYYLVERGP